MRRLKKRNDLDDLKNQPRARRQSIIRWLYLTSIAALAIWLGNLFFGDLLYFRSEGLVLSESAVVAAEFPVTVRALPVREGERVSTGDVAAVVTSQSAVENIARLTADLAGREARISELRIRRQTIDAIIGVAESRQMVAVNARREYEKLLEQGFLALDKRTAVIESEFRSRQDLESLNAEKRVIDGELETVSRAFAEAEQALWDLRRLYDDGKMRVPIDGVVSRIVANQGAVVRAGDPLVEVYGNNRFVLAYLPTGALYDVAPGDHVQIETGLRVSEGRVTHVQPFAAALPREFQRTFSPVDRRQVVRIEFLPGEAPPPLFSKVRLRSASVLPGWIKAVRWPSTWNQASAVAATPVLRGASLH
jgi:multidrug resistance efflux pump